MGRFAAGCALIVLLVCPFAWAADAEMVLTHCEESEIRIDHRHSVAGLGRCSDATTSNLLWHLDRIDQVTGSLDGHFARRSRGSGVTIYVFDTGILSTHDEFAIPNGTRVVAGFDSTARVPFGASECRSPNKATAPCFTDYAELPAAAHGTSVASIAAGKNVGVAPEASIVSIRVMNERGLATTAAYLDGLDAVIRHAWATPSATRTSIVNISGWVLEQLTSSRLEARVPYGTIEKKMRDMIGGVDAAGKRDATGKRFLFVVAGNNVDGGCGRDGVVDRFPAILGPHVEGLITVGGMTQDNVSWPGSCRGGIEVLAPAQSVFSATITANDHYRSRHDRNGTSFAVPVISGIAALVLSDRTELTPQQLERSITSTPSRVLNPEQGLAGGKVALLIGVEPPRVVAQQVRLAP